MQKFASEFANDEFLQEFLAKLSWNHNQVLLDKIKDGIMFVGDETA